MARGRRKPKRQTAAPGKRGQAAAPGGAAPEAADLPVGESAGGAAPKAAAPDTPPPEAPPAERDPAAPVGLPSRGGTVEIEARPDDPIVLAVPGPQAVTVTRRNGDLAFDLGSEGALLIRGFLSLHEEGRAPALSVGDAALPPDRILAALRAGEAQYGNGSGVARPAEPEDMTVVAVPSGEGVGVVGLLAPDGLAFEMPPIGSGEAAEALPPLATDKVFAMPEDLATPHPIVGRLFDEDDPGAPTRYLSTTGSFRTAQGGSVMIGVDGLFEYRSPEGGFDGEDSFAFTVSDGVRSETATVTIVAAPIGAAGEMTAARGTRGTRGAGRGGAAEPGGGPGHVYETVQDSALEVGPERGLLADCFAAGKLAAQVLSAGTIVTAEGGSVEMDADGAFAYMPRPRFVGRDHFAVTMEPGDGEAERILGVVIEVGEAEAAPSPERAPRFAVMEIPLGPRPAGRERASVTVALAESREVVRPAHYLALDYHDGTAWTPFANGGEVPLAPGQEVLTLRGLALDEAGNPLFQTPDAFEVAATAPDGEDLIAGEPHCWLADPADDGEEDLAAAAPADDDESGAAEGEGAYSYFDIPMAAEDRAAGIVTLLVSYDADLPDGVRLQLEYLDGFAWIPFDNGGVVPTEEDRLHVRALLSAADGSALPADGDRFRFSISRPAALPPGVGADAEEGPEGDAGPAPAAAEVDLPLPPAPPGTRAVTLWVTDDEADGESLDMAYFADGEWHAFASGETLPVGAEADGIRLRLALLDGEGRPLPVDLERFRFEALPVPPADGETGAEPADAPEARAGAEPDFEPGGEPDAEPAAEPGEPVDAAMDAAVRRHGDIEAEPPEPGPDAAEAAAPAAPADRPDFVYYGESVDPTGGRDLPLTFDALAWAWPADEDWPLPWRGAADAGARRTDAGADAPSADGAEEEAETEAEAALAAVEAHPDFDPSETFALIFNIDVSGSMAWSFDGRQRPSLMYEESRLGVAVQAIKDLLALFVEEGFAGRTRVRLQPFTNRFVEDDAASFPNLTDMPAIHRYLDGLFAGGITRYEPVMEAAAQWLAEPENRCRYNRIYVLSDGGDNVGYQPISTTVRQLYTAYNGPGQPNLDIFAYGLGAGADELEPERLGALKTGKVVLDPLAPSEAAEKASVILVTAPDNLFAVLADTAPSGDSAPRPSYGAAGGVVMGGEGESDRPVGVVRNRLVLNWQLGDEGTIAHPSVSTVSDFQVGDVGHDPLASVADISGLLPANLVRRPRDLGAYVQAGVRGRDLEIHVDVDGSIQGFQPQQIIILRGCGAAFSPESESDSILKTLIETGNLVIASQR
jgi:hypothetical protein